MKIKGFFKKFTPNGFSGFLKSEKGDLFFSLSQAKKAGYEKNDFIPNYEFEVEIIESDRGGFKVKYFLKKKEEKNTMKQTKVAPFKSKFDTNFNLFLNKPNHQLIGTIFTKKDNKKEFKLESRAKEIEKFNFSGVDFAKLNENNISNAKNLYQFFDKSLCLKPDWRLTIGLGGASVYETNITLHHVYGIPYIPASSIKGVVRSWIITEYFGTEEMAGVYEKDFPLVNAEYRALMNKDFCDFFGSPSEAKNIEFQDGKPNPEKKPKFKKCKERQGSIIFFDAYPIESPKISIDIMNVHFKDYYNSERNKKTGKYENVKPPADWSTPNIINFLTIKETPFQFLLAGKNDIAKKNILTSIKLGNKSIIEWLKEALTDHGIGAKTAVGYGYFE